MMKLFLNYFKNLYKCIMSTLKKEDYEILRNKLKEVNDKNQYTVNQFDGIFIETKKILYLLLLKQFENLTDNELDIMMLLSEDEEIQKLFDKY